MSLDAIWDEPIASPPKPAPDDAETSPQKRPRQSLFLSDSDSDYERAPKRATPAPPPANADVDALFEDLDKQDEEDEDLRYKPLAPALDLEKLAKEAEAKHGRVRRTATSQTLADGSKIGTAGTIDKDSSGKGDWRSNPGEEEKTARKALPKLDEERLVRPDGFPLLIEEIKGFKPKGKGNEHTDLNRLLQIYQFWSHRMFPKTSFKDTVDRVEKLCHSKRMQVRLSVWRDEFKGLTNGKKMEDDPDIIDLTEPTLVRTADTGDDKEFENPPLMTDRESSHTPSLPPASEEVDDEFDIDAVIKAEEERLATLRAVTADPGSAHSSHSPTLLEKASAGSVPKENGMDVDEVSLLDAFGDPPTLFDPPQSGHSSSAPVDDDEDTWKIVDEIEREEQSRPIKTQIPISGFNLIPSGSMNSENASRATNDDDWDEMYS